MRFAIELILFLIVAMGAWYVFKYITSQFVSGGNKPKQRKKKYEGNYSRSGDSVRTNRHNSNQSTHKS